MSTVLKRFEIWILLGLVLAAIWWAFQTEPTPMVAETESKSQSGISNTSAENREGESGLLEVRKVDIDATPEGTVMELTLFGRSGTEEPVALSDETVELLTTEGEGVHRFYVPFDPDPLLSAEEKSLVKLRYWLKTPVDVLWLTYRDQTLKVEVPGASI